MKKTIGIVTLICLMALALNTFAQPWAWIQKNNFTGVARSSPAWFTINGFGYMGMGYDGAGLNDFWKYNPTNDSWTQMANFTGTARWSCPSFSIGSNGYVFGGNASGYFSDFYKYNSVTNAWSLLTSTAPLPGRQDSYGCTLNGKGYVTTGYSSIDRKDTWQYDTLANAWTQMADYGGTERDAALGFVINNKMYVGTGQTGAVLHTDFYKYDPDSNTWAAIANFPGAARNSAVGFAIDSIGFAGAGFDINSGVFYKDFYEYHPATNTWTTSTATFPDINGIAYPFIFPFNHTVFIGTGRDSSTTYINKVFQLITTEGVTEVSRNNDDILIFPNPVTDLLTISFTADKIKSCTIILYDMLGEKIIVPIKSERQTTMDVSKLLQGIYFLEVNMAGQKIVKKVVKM